MSCVPQPMRSECEMSGSSRRCIRAMISRRASGTALPTTARVPQYVRSERDGVEMSLSSRRIAATFTWPRSAFAAIATIARTRSPSRIPMSSEIFPPIEHPMTIGASMPSASSTRMWKSA